MNRSRSKLVIIIACVVIIALGYLLFSCTQDRNVYQTESESVKERVRACAHKNSQYNKQLTECMAKTTGLNDANTDLLSEIKNMKTQLIETQQEVDAQNTNFVKLLKFYESLKGILGKENLSNEPDGNIAHQNLKLLLDAVEEKEKSVSALTQKLELSEKRYMQAEKQMKEMNMKDKKSKESQKEEKRKIMNEISQLKKKLGKAHASFDEEPRGLKKKSLQQDTDNVKFEHLDAEKKSYEGDANEDVATTEKMEGGEDEEEVQNENKKDDQADNLIKNESKDNDKREELDEKDDSLTKDDPEKVHDQQDSSKGELGSKVDGEKLNEKDESIKIDIAKRSVESEESDEDAGVFEYDNIGAASRKTAKAQEQAEDAHENNPDVLDIASEEDLDIGSDPVDDEKPEKIEDFAGDRHVDFDEVV